MICYYKYRFLFLYLFIIFIKNMSIQDISNIIGNFSQLLLVILGLFVFLQIKIAKDSFKTQCERDAISRSMDLAGLFAEKIIPKMDVYYEHMKDEKITLSVYELSDFCMSDIDSLSPDKKDKCKSDIRFFNENKELRKECIYIFNDLEALAINFTKRLADEESLFTALSQAYCSFIEKNYAVVCLCRKTKNDLFYVNMIDVYKTWSQRIKLKGLLVEKQGLDNKVAEINKICNNKYTPKGV